MKIINNLDGGVIEIRTDKAYRGNKQVITIHITPKKGWTFKGCMTNRLVKVDE